MSPSPRHDEAQERLRRAFLTLTTPEEVGRFLEDLMTPGEVDDFVLRLEVARLLYRGETYEQVIAGTGVSSATISRIRRFLFRGAGGYAMVLDRLGEHGTVPR